VSVAKKCKVVKNDRRRAVVARYAQRRAELKEIIRSPSSAVEQRAAAQRELARQPRDATAVRLRNRDSVDGRPRGHLRKFGLSRVRVRQFAHNGQLPGVRKASW
jgi:small subunit ribosomal protein S14